MATGKATIFGLDGTVAYSGVAQYVDTQSLTLTEQAQVDEFISGSGELLGFNVRDKRRTATLEMFPKGASAAQAKQGLRLPSYPCKVTLSAFTDESAPNAQINGDWIYVGGGSIAWSSGQARLTLPIMQPLTSPLTVDQLVAVVT